MSKYGKVEAVNVIKDSPNQQSRGFAFVTFVENAGAKECIEALNRKEFRGKVVLAEYAKRAKPYSSTPGVYLGKSKRRERSDSRDYRRRRNSDEC